MVLTLKKMSQLVLCYSHTHFVGIPAWLALSGLYLWAAIFFTRPHKVICVQYFEGLMQNYCNYLKKHLHVTIVLQQALNVSSGFHSVVVWCSKTERLLYELN